MGSGSARTPDLSACPEADLSVGARPEERTNTPAIQTLSLSKRFGDALVLDEVSLAVQRQETVCVLGPSGSGKSTLLRCINHLEVASSGLVLVNGQLMGYEIRGNRLLEMSERKVARQRRHLGMVFQQFNLFPHMTALENVVCAPHRLLGVPRRISGERGLELLAKVGLSDKRDARPNELSGGQQQRVAIARALAMEPDIMLFDEPTSALDPELVGEVLDVVRALASGGMTALIVTHEIGFAREVADRVIFMEGGQIVDEGPPLAVLDAGRSPRMRQFLSRAHE